MTGTVFQATSAPTRKLSAVMIGAAVMEVLRPPILSILDIFSTVDVTLFGNPISLFAGLGSEGFSSAIFVAVDMMVMFACGYNIKDAPNVVALLPPEPPPTTT